MFFPIIYFFLLYFNLHFIVVYLQCILCVIISLCSVRTAYLFTEVRVCVCVCLWWYVHVRQSGVSVILPWRLLDMSLILPIWCVLVLYDFKALLRMSSLRVAGLQCRCSYVIRGKSGLSSRRPLSISAQMHRSSPVTLYQLQFSVALQICVRDSFL